MSSPDGLLDRLADPSVFAAACERVELIDTHISRLYLCADRVYKVKRPVDLGFLDFSTLDRRRFFCSEEVRLNQALAPGVCLGVVPVVQTEAGELRVGSTDAPPAEGQIIEWAVEMRRLNAGHMLDRLLDTGVVDNQLMNRLAEKLVDFHRSADTGSGIDQYGAIETVSYNVLENFEQTEMFASSEPGALVSRRLHSFLETEAKRQLGAHREVFDARVRAGRVREGHGDLHAGNICVEHDDLVIYDRIEFSERLRCGDVAVDLAFLAMDLDYRGFRGFSRFLVRRYASLARDEELSLLMPFYKAYRAMVRAKVAAIRSTGSGTTEARQGARLESMRFFHLAATYALPRALVLMCGLPASGKSWLARALARPFEAVQLRSDRRRKQLHHMAPTQSAASAYGQGLYDRDSSDRTYRSLLDSARDYLLRGRTVVVDAAFGEVARRRAMIELATELKVPVVVVHVEAAEEKILERMQRRRQDPDEISDADLEIYRAARARFEAPDAGEANLLSVESEMQPAEVVVGQLLDRLIELR